jgi:hypothetical protein
MPFSAIRGRTYSVASSAKATYVADESGTGWPYDRAEDLIADVEVVMREAGALVRQDPVVGILGGVFRHRDAKARALLHALEDEIDAVGVLRAMRRCQGRTWSFLRAPFSAHSIGSR